VRDIDPLRASTLALGNYTRTGLRGPVPPSTARPSARPPLQIDAWGSAHPEAGALSSTRFEMLERLGKLYEDDMRRAKVVRWVSGRATKGIT
jgi:hypothetical protein